ADVHVRLGALELTLGHWCKPLLLGFPGRPGPPRGDGLAWYACAGGRRRLRLLHHRFGDVVRRFLVVVELHRERGATLRHRTQRGGVAEHLAQRDHRVDDLARRAVVLALQHAAATA